MSFEKLKVPLYTFEEYYKLHNDDDCSNIEPIFNTKFDLDCFVLIQSEMLKLELKEKQELSLGSFLLSHFYLKE